MQREALAAGDDALELTGGPMAEDGARPAGEDGGEPTPLLADEGMTDRVDASMEPV